MRQSDFCWFAREKFAGLEMLAILLNQRTAADSLGALAAVRIDGDDGQFWLNRRYEGECLALQGCLRLDSWLTDGLRCFDGVAHQRLGMLRLVGRLMGRSMMGRPADIRHLLRFLNSYRLVYDVADHAEFRRCPPWAMMCRRTDGDRLRMMFTANSITDVDASQSIVMFTIQLDRTYF